MPGPEARAFTPGRAAVVLGVLAVACVLAAIAGVCFGEAPVSLRVALADPTSTDASIFWALRVPRVALAALVGAALGASGCTLQSLLRNPLADPFILGVSGGAALGATLALALGLGGTAGWLSFSAPAAFAFAGSLGAAALVFSIGWRSRASPYVVLLVGVVFNSFAAAVITCVKALSPPDRVGNLLYWLAGSLDHELELTPGTFASAGLLQLAALAGLWALSGRLNVLTLGDEDAATLGVPVTRTRVAALLLTSLSVGGAVALSGLVGFVGLIIPHLLRLVLGPDQRLLLPASALGAAAFLPLSDLVARLSFPVFHQTLPVGVVTALAGVPFFVLLLVRRESAAAGGG
jgi:iron complex transport system permease protein